MTKHLSNAVVPDDIEELLRRLTLAEQVSLLAGADFWTTVPIRAWASPP